MILSNERRDKILEDEANESPEFEARFSVGTGFLSKSKAACDNIDKSGFSVSFVNGEIQSKNKLVDFFHLGPWGMQILHKLFWLLPFNPVRYW